MCFPPAVRAAAVSLTPPFWSPLLLGTGTGPQLWGIPLAGKGQGLAIGFVPNATTTCSRFVMRAAAESQSLVCVVP